MSPTTAAFATQHSEHSAVTTALLGLGQCWGQCWGSAGAGRPVALTPTTWADLAFSKQIFFSPLCVL